MTDREQIATFVQGAGYDGSVPLAIGVSLASGARVAFAASATTPFDGETIAYAGSLAKQMTGACACLLAREGTLDPDTPIVKWLPELPGWSRRICVRHLIHHTSALPADEVVWEQMKHSGESDWTSAGVLAALSEFRELQNHPGHTYAYSSVGYVCLGRIIERVSGTSLNTFAHGRLFKPLEMRRTIIWSGPELCPPDAVGLPPPRNPAPLSVGDGGLWTSVGDLLLWNDALLSDALGISDMLHAPGSLDNGTPLEYAWGVRVFRASGLTVQSHGGSWRGATAKLVRLPDRRASFAALALGGGVERMAALSSALQDALSRS